MTKVEFIAKAAEKTDLSQKDVSKALDAIETTLLEDVFAVEESVRLKIGTFSGYTKETSARVGRNPKDGSVVNIPAKVIKGYPKFKPSKLAKE